MAHETGAKRVGGEKFMREQSNLRFAKEGRNAFRQWLEGNKNPIPGTENIDDEEEGPPSLQARARREQG